MPALFSGLFTNTGTEFELNYNDASNFSNRLGLYDSGTDFYVRRVLTGIDFTSVIVNEDFAFTITFTDDCRSTTLTAQTITFSDITWNIDTDTSISVPAFQDSLDSGGGHTIGTCGEKVVTLDSSTPGFLALTADSGDPILNPFTIAYTQSASESDIRAHTITYEVTSSNYDGIVAPLTAQTFTLNIVCPSHTTGSTVVSSLVTSYEYDIARRQLDSLTAPVVTLEPSTCFQVESLIIYDTITTAPVAGGYITANGLVSIDISTNDRLLVGLHNL